MANICARQIFLLGRVNSLLDKKLFGMFKVDIEVDSYVIIEYGHVFFPGISLLVREIRKIEAIVMGPKSIMLLE